MATLIDVLPFTVLKGLSKRYLKILQARDPATAASLMQVQEDLARAAGHRDAHAAQVYWEQKVAAPSAASSSAPTPEDPEAAPVAVRAAEAEHAAQRMAPRRFPVSWDPLLRGAGESLASLSDTFDTETLVNQVLGQLEGLVEPHHREAALLQMRQRLEKGVEGLVAVRGVEECWTSRAWEDGQRRLAKRSVMQDETLNVRPPMPTEDSERDRAVAHACGPSTVTVVCADASSDRHAVARYVVMSHRRARWSVVGTAVSQEATRGLQESMPLHKHEAVDLDVLLKGGANEWTDRVLVVLNDAEMASAQAAATLLDLASRSNARVKVLALGREGVRMGPHALEALSRNVPVQRLGRAGATAVAPSPESSRHPPFSSENAERPQRVAADPFLLSTGQREARAVDPAVIGRAFLQVLQDPDKHWAERPFREFSDAVATRAAELDHAASPPRRPRP